MHERQIEFLIELAIKMVSGYQIFERDRDEPDTLACFCSHHGGVPLPLHRFFLLYYYVPPRSGFFNTLIPYLDFALIDLSTTSMTNSVLLSRRFLTQCRCAGYHSEALVSRVAPLCPLTPEPHYGVKKARH